MVLGTWCGDVATELAKAAEEGTMTAELVAAAPMAGLTVWQAAGRSYAKQLEARGQVAGPLFHCYFLDALASIYLIRCK